MKKIIVVLAALAAAAIAAPAQARCGEPLYPGNAWVETTTYTGSIGADPGEAYGQAGYDLYSNSVWADAAVGATGVGVAVRGGSPFVCAG